MCVQSLVPSSTLKTSTGSPLYTVDYDDEMNVSCVYGVATERFQQTESFVSSFFEDKQKFEPVFIRVDGENKKWILQTMYKY